jgi:tetratricopeptide (TPR) repeat protein
MFAMVRRRTVLVLALLALVVITAGVAGVFGWAQYHLFQARAAVEHQDFVRAHGHMVNVLRVWPRSAALHLEAAQIARRGHLFAEAEQHLADCQRLHQGVNDAIRLERLLLRAMDGDVAAVQESLWRLIDADHPDKLAILEALVQGYMKISFSGAGQAAIARLLELQPDNVVGLYGRGVGWEHLEDEESAIADFRRVLAIQPRHADARKQLADLLLRDDPRESLNHLQLLRRQRPGDPEVLVSQARCWKALGRPAEASQILDALLADHSDHVDALILRGLLAVEDGQAPEGEKWLRRAIRLQPGNEQAHYHLYECLLQQPSRPEEARAQFAQWKRVRADRIRLHEIAATQMDRALRDPAVLYELGSILLRIKQEEDGLRLLRTALEIQPDHESAHRTLAEYYHSKGKDDLAEQHQKRIRSR